VPHRYRIDWNAKNVVYAIDGTVVATHSLALTSSMRPLASDFTVGGGTLVVDWLWMPPMPRPRPSSPACSMRGER
jgi:hypothetical protein